MNYSIDIKLNYIAKVELGGDLYYNKDFTLTVKAVNDAPIVLHPLKESYLTGDAAMVLNPV